MTGPLDVQSTITSDGLTVDGQGTFTTPDNSAQVTLISTDTDALVGPQLNLWRNSGTGTNGDLIGQITFTGEDTVGSTNTFASIYSVADQTNNGAEDGSIHFQTLINGVLADRLEINSAGNTIVTGTLTSDGLTVDGSATINASLPNLYITETDTTDLNTRFALQSGVQYLASVNDAFSVTKNRISWDNSTGDISFYEDTGTTAKFFWDASAESLGIGTTSPAGILQLKASNPDLYITSDNTGQSDIYFGGTTTPTKGRVQYSDNSDFMAFWTNSGQSMIIDSSGNVGIGTGSPSDRLHVSGSASVFKQQNNVTNWTLGLDAADSSYKIKNNGTERMRIDSSGYVGIGTSSPNQALHIANSGFAYARMQSTGYGGTGFDIGQHSAGSIYLNNRDNTSIVLQTNNTERMRINSSGDWMVSNTVANVASGFSAQAGCGWVDSDTHFEIATTSNRAALEVGKNNANDGTLVIFRKQNATVGSIASRAGVVSTIVLNPASGNGAGLSGGTKCIVPADEAGIIDNDVSLGISSHRFKDLYLSGGVYLGGTGSANKLDDYEEGSWTPAIEYDTNGTLSVAYSQRNGAYTKVGNMVTIWGVIRLNGFSKGTASGSLKFTGLPFSSTSTGYRTDLKVLSYRAPFNGPGGFGAMIDNGSSYIACVYSRDNDTWTAEADPDSNSEYFFSGSYFTTA
jgi:hypothetical protein